MIEVNGLLLCYPAGVAVKAFLAGGWGDVHNEDQFFPADYAVVVPGYGSAIVLSGFVTVVAPITVCHFPCFIT